MQKKTLQWKKDNEKVNFFVKCSTFSNKVSGPFFVLLSCIKFFVLLSCITFLFFRSKFFYNVVKQT